jgi:hypothetical protein
LKYLLPSVSIPEKELSKDLAILAAVAKDLAPKFTLLGFRLAFVTHKPEVSILKYTPD